MMRHVTVLPNQACIVEARLSNKYPGVIWTKSDFFDRIITYAFLFNRNMILDENAPFGIITRLLVNRGSRDVLYATHHSKLFHTITASAVTIKSVYFAAKELGFKGRSVECLDILCAAEEEMQASNIVTKNMALLAAVPYLSQFGTMFPQEFKFVNILALSEIEKKILNTIKINSEYLCAAKPEVNVYSYSAQNREREADGIAKIVFDLRVKAQHISKIAIALRKPGSRSGLIVDALRRHNIPVRLRFNQDFSCAPDILRLKNLLLARAMAEPKDRIRAHLARPSSIGETAEQVVKLLETVPLSAPLKQYINLVLGMLSEQSERLVEKLHYVRDFLQDNHLEISLADFVKWFDQVCQTISWPRQYDELDASAVEIVGLKDIVGREFDSVLIADMVYGQIPSIRTDDPIFDRDDLLAINKKLRCKIFSDDESDLAVEKALYKAAKAAANVDVICVSSRHDEAGKETAPSMFFESESSIGYQLPVTAAFAMRDRSKNRVKKYKKIVDQRTEFISNKNFGEYAFSTDSELFRRIFEQNLGFSKKYPLSATRVERMASCRYRGFLQDLLKIAVDEDETHDTDSRILGNLAHEALKEFYEGTNSHRSNLIEILKNKSKKYIENENVGNRAVFEANITWLETALLRLVSNMGHDETTQTFTPRKFEHRVGPAPIVVGDETLYFRGIIDRVDYDSDAVLVIDYKLSTSKAIESKVREKELMRKHFQLPLYMHLIAGQDVGGYLVSIKDGSRSRIIQPSSDASALSDGLNSVLGPLFVGNVPADIGLQCKDCKFKPVCRVHV